ncbi:MAG: acylneuraminate cytidylyltransferase family protein [Candidatus Nealsonbacteria bacterium]
MKNKFRKIKTVVFLPLRGGSKSIPLKNIKPIAGKPLSFWGAQAALKCSLVDKLVVSTDSDAIRKKFRQIKSKKLKVIDRSSETATDKASTESAMLEFAKNNDWFEYIILIQATSPLLESRHLKEAINKFFRNKCDSLLSVVRQKRFIWQEKRGRTRPVNYNPLKRPMRQDFEGFLVENGAFYITSRKRLLRTKCRISGKMGVYEMPEETYFEMDEPSDWIIIESFLKKAKVEKQKNKRRA